MTDINDFISSDRRHFEQDELDESSIPENPEVLFKSWFKSALSRQNPEPYAFTLLSHGLSGFPEGRTVYLRAFEPDGGLVFFSNYDSDKGQQMAADPKVGALFFWPMSERQVRIRGVVSRASDEVSDAYFASRPRESQIGAWASLQSSRLTSRQDLEDRVEEVRIRFEGKEVPRPEYWGGFLITPLRYEFWQGRPNRLHDRICFEKSGSSWKMFRLSP